MTGSDRIVWYFSWILGLGLALAVGVLNAMWYEIGESGESAGSARAHGPDR